MKLIDFVLNQDGGSTTFAQVAVAHACDSGCAPDACRQTLGKPSTGALRNPTTLAASRGNPDSHLAILVDYLQRPLGVKFKDVEILNRYRFNRIHNDKVGFTEYEFGAYPAQTCDGGNNGADSKIEPDGAGIQCRLNHKERVKSQSRNTPKEVALGSKNYAFAHSSIFTGFIAIRKGKQL